MNNSTSARWFGRFWRPVPDVLMKHPTEATVYMALAWHADNGTGKAWPSLDRLASMTDKSERTVRRALRRLEVLGCLVTEFTNGHASVYQLLHPVTKDEDTPDTSDRPPRTPVTPELKGNELDTSPTERTATQSEHQMCWQVIYEAFGRPTSEKDRAAIGAGIKRWLHAGYDADDLRRAALQWAAGEPEGRWRNNPLLFINSAYRWVGPLASVTFDPRELRDRLALEEARLRDLEEEG